MKQIITAKLKLQTDAAQFMVLRATQLAYHAALNSVSRYSFEQGRTLKKIVVLLTKPKGKHY